MNIYFSMAAFALAASITPGPVNILALSAGAQFGFNATLRHVLGATLGFTLLLILIGLGLHQLLTLWPVLTKIIQWAGSAFLLFMAYQLAFDDGRLGNDQPTGGRGDRAGHDRGRIQRQESPASNWRRGRRDPR